MPIGRKVIMAQPLGSELHIDASISNLCLNITLRCNEKCIFCWRNFETADKELTLDRLLNIIPYLKTLSVKKINITGGEPTLHKQLLQILSMLKDVGFVLSLTTNATLYEPRICDYLDYLSFSIETLDEEKIKTLGRKPSYIKNVVRYLEYIRFNDLPTKIKINTVITKVNAAERDIQHIAEFITQYIPPIYRWKLFPFRPIRRAFGRTDLSVEPSKYIHLLNMAKNLLQDKVIVTDMGGHHFLIDGDGLLYSSDGNQDIVIAKLSL